MKKRIKQKMQKIKNANRQEHILHQIAQHFTIQSKVFGNGYFIFSMGASSVCHFELKETPDWLYGIWLHDTGYEIFGEHGDLIDKFKPSRTYVSVENNVNAFIDKIKAIQANPILYFVDALTGSALEAYKEHPSPEGTWYTGYQVVREYNKETGFWDTYKRDTAITQEAFVKEKYEEHLREKQELEEQKELDRTFAFEFFKKLPHQFEEIQAVGVEDRNQKGRVCSPRYQLKLVVDVDCSQEKIDTLFERVDALVHEKNYGEGMKYYDHTFDLHGVYDDARILRNCHYQYKKTS